MLGLPRKVAPVRGRARAVLALGAAGVLVAGLAACSGSSASSSQKMSKDDVLTITTFSTFGYNALIKKWNADPNRPFTVKQTVVSDWDPWKEKLTRELQSGTGLTDVIAVEGDAMPAFLAGGASDQFVDISDKSLDGRWLDFKYKGGQTNDGKQIGYPTDAGPEAFCYRSDLFAKAGLPSKREDVTSIFSSWDSYLKAGEAFHKKVPDVAWFDSTFVTQAMLNQQQYPFQAKDQKVDVDNPGLKQVFDTVAAHIPTLSSKVPPWDTDWQAKMKAGQIATIPCPGWMFANIKENAPAVKGWDVADAFPGGGGNWGGSYLAVPKQSKHPAEAKKLADWLTNADSEVAAFKEAGNFPANVAAEQTLAKQNATDPYLNNAPTMKILADRAAAVKPDLPYKGDKYSDILALLLSAMQRIDEGASPASSWATFTKAVDGLA